jgi:hypothetical protein
MTVNLGSSCQVNQGKRQRRTQDPENKPWLHICSPKKFDDFATLGERLKSACQT